MAERQHDDPRLRDGVIVIDKPMGPSSHQVSAWVRDILDVEKAGHGGTLDPRVTGVLVIMLNEATRAVPALRLGDKEYVGVIRFHRDVPPGEVEAIAREFTGPIYQTPPLRSAVKRRLRVRAVRSFDVVEVRGRDALVRLTVEAGTYIRTIARDIGRALGTGAHLQELRRTRSCSFTVEDAVTLQDLVDAVHFWREDGEEDALEGVILPFGRLFDHLPRVVVKNSAVDALCHGAPLMAPGVSRMIGDVSRGGYVAVVTSRGEVVGLGRAVADGMTLMGMDRGPVVRMTRVFMRPGTYYRVWKVSG